MWLEAKPRLFDFFLHTILKMEHDKELLKDARHFFRKCTFDVNGIPQNMNPRPTLSFQKLNPLALDLKECGYQTGMYDIHVSPGFCKTINPDEKMIVTTGLAVKIPLGCVGRLICDPLWYQELVFVDEMFISHNYLAVLNIPVVNYSNEPFEIRPYMRFAQLVLFQCEINADLVEVED